MPAERREYSRTELSMVGVIQRFPGRSLHRMPWCFRPVRTDGARRRVLHARRVEGRTPALVVILGQLQVVALTMHAHRNAPDPRPRVEPRAQCPERTVVGGHGAPGESYSRSQELAAV